MTKETKHTLQFLTVLIVSFLALDRVFGIMALKVLVDMPAASNEIAKMNYQIEKADYDCYILGSSRAVHHYNPKILSDSLGLSVYNAGRDGQGISYASGLLKAIIDRKKPKIIILECGQIELDKKWLEKMGALKPYYFEHPQVMSLAERISGKREHIKCFFSAYRFNSSLFPILKTYLRPQKDKLRGYEPESNGRIANLSYRSDKCEPLILDSLALDVLRDFIFTCNANNIKLVVCCSPILEDYHLISEELQHLFTDLNVTFFDYSNDQRFINHIDMFGDYVHLNSTGADIYTKLIVNDLKTIRIVETNK